MLAAHKTWLAHSAYMPKLPWRKAEQDVFKTASRLANSLTTPIFTVPPAGDFDHDAGRITTPAEHVRGFGAKLAASRKQAPVFVDAVYLDNERHRVDTGVHPLTALLERARLLGALAWPLTSFARSDEYQEAVAKYHLRHRSPVALEIGLSDLGTPDLAQRLTSLCNQVSCDPDDAVLVLNGGPLSINERDEEFFAKWPAPGSEDTELGVLMEPEVGHGEASVHAGVQA
jgi:Beta protein